MAELKFKDKTISILGDSISTFKGVIPERNASRYPQDNLVTELNGTWWMMVINHFGARLGVNNSWAGSQVSNIYDKPEGNLGPDRCMASFDRISTLGNNGKPDVIFLYGGTNDLGRALYNVGTFSSDLVPQKVDLDSKKWKTFIEGYIAAVMRIMHTYPETELVALLPGYVVGYFTPERLDFANGELIKLCEYFDISYIDLRECGITFENATDLLPDGIHPGKEAMKLISSFVISSLEK